MNYSDQLLRQFNNATKPGIQTFLKKLYGLVENEITAMDRVIEVGAGAGISQLFIDKAILRTDLFSFENRVSGDNDCHNLKYKENEFNGLIAIDVLHHLAEPTVALGEFKRIVNFGRTPTSGRGGGVGWFSSSLMFRQLVI